MRILYIITKSELGGAQTHVAQLMEHMKSEGHDVALMSYPGGWLEKKCTDLNISFYLNHFFSNSFNPFRALRAMKVIQKAVRDFSPEIVHCHSSGAGIFTRFAIRNRVPTIFTAHGWAFSPGTPRLRRMIALLVEKAVSSFSEKIICVSTYDYNLALQHRIVSKNKLTVVHNGIELILNTEKQSGDIVTILSVGRLSYQKRHDVLIEAFSKLPKDISPKAHLVIIGDGPDHSSLSNKIAFYGLESTVTLRGHMSRPDVLKMLGEADVFALISRYEGFPMTILEAMNAELPVIASNVGGNTEAVDASCGIIVRNIEEVINALQTLIIDREKRVTLGQAGKRKVAHDFSLELFLEKTKKVYESVLLKRTS